MRYSSKNEYTDNAKIGYPSLEEHGMARGFTNMTGEKGNKLARVIPEDSLRDTLATDPQLDKNSQKQIGEQLRAMYDELMQQPIPDRFRELLDKLDKSDEERKDRPR